MSEKSEMWDRFFAGSKYEHKWRENNTPPPAPIVDGSEEFRSWLERLSDERATEPPRAETVNPFGDSADRKSAA